jgi:hypothetical protein
VTALDAYVARLLADAPPLTREQLDRLRDLLGGTADFADQDHRDGDRRQ